MSMRDYRDMESLKAHAGKLEAENGMYKQQLMESHQSHLDSVARYNHLKNEMDQLRECYRSLTEDSHKMKMMYESQCEELNKDKAESQTLRAQCTAVTQKWQSVTQNWQLLSNENQELEKMNKAMKLENEKLSNELVNLRSMKDHDYALLCREKDELAKNHHLVMSERDGVHKEIDMLNDRIAKADSKVSQLEHERKQMNDKVVTYKQELQAALRDRDQAQKHIADILNDSSLDHSRLRMALENRLLDTSRPDRNEVNEEQPRPLVPSYDTKESPPDVHSSKEVENLLKEISLLQQELKEAKDEAAVCILRRDWAFQERDKIVQERESIRRQCDELRRERDRAVSNHAEELRTLDDLKKFKAVTTRELTEMREKLDKEERRNHLTAGSNSRDSAIDNDYQDWDTETLEYDIELSNNMYHMDLGIDLSCSGGDLSDPVLYVNSIAKGSPCDGKLRVNDVLLRVNNVDMTSASKERALDAIKSSPSSVVNLKVRRKKAIGRFNIPVAFRLNKKDLGLQLESGVYISKISPGSYLAKEGNVAVGDRVLLVNNKSVEHKTAKEVMKMIEGSGDYIVLHVGKYGVMPADNNSPPSINGSNSLIEKVKNKFRNSDKNLSSKQHQPNVSADTGTGTTSKRHKSSTGGRHGIFSLFKTTSSSDDKDESDTIKVKTDHVMSILEKMHRGAGDVDMGSLSSAPCSDGVDVSTFGTVTFKQRPHSKPAIPNSIVDHDKIYSTKPQRHNSGDPIDSKMDRQVRTPSYYPSTSYSPQSPLDRISVTSSTLFDRHAPIYEPKVQTLPNQNGSLRMHVPKDKKSNSLEGHASGRGDYPDPLYPPNAEVRSLDMKVQDMLNKRIAADERKDRRRPTNFQRAITPSDNNRLVPSSPLHKNRQFTLESPLSHNFGFNDSTRPSSVASQPTTGSRSSSSSQMFFSTSSNPHKIFQPSCSPPPPYSEKMYNSPFFMSPNDRYNHKDGNDSSIAPYQSHTLDRKFAPGSSQIHHAVPVRPASSTDYSTARVKFPSNHSVSSNKRSLNSNSLEIVSSGRSSPLSSPMAPEFYYRKSEEFIHGRGTNLRHKKLKEGVLRELELDTSFEHLGITITEQPGTGIFITSVSPKSLAAEVGIEKGDQIIEFCGINMRTASYEMALTVLKSWQSGDGKVKMKVQYNPKRCKHFPEQSQDVDKNSVTGSIQTIHAYLENGHSQKKPLYVVHSNGSSSDESGTDPPRKITVQRMSQEVGLRLCGGNITGVFIAEISSDSPFSNSDLRIADQLLVINGKDLKGFTAEQVATELNRPSDTISVVAQHNLNKYSMIHAGSGDHFYVRAHFKYEAETAEELSISPGDLFRVENSLLYGQIGKWYVCKIDEKDNKIGSSGVVPSRIKMEESYSLRRSYSDVMPDEDSKSSKRNGSIGRRSFFKRRSGRHQHQRSGSKDSRELTSFSDLSASNDNVPTADDGAPLLYQRVEKIKCHYPRPVVILGPFAEALIQKLVNESFDKFKEYEEEFLNTDNTVIEDDISKGVFVDYKKVNDLFKVTRTDTLHRIAQSNRHSLLRVHPLAIDRMRRCKLYPIVIYIKHKSLKQIKEVKDPRFLPDHLSSKSAKELFEYFSKIELEFKNLFTVEVQGANMAAMHQNIKRVVDEEQEKHVWL